MTGDEALADVIGSVAVRLFRSDRDLFFSRSTAADVYLNLAREEFLFDGLPDDSRCLFLYVDSPAVVFGKHQNPWRECSVDLLRKRNIQLARRISGGGTVYHDLGNLNFSFMLPKSGFDRKANLAIVVRALRRLGLEPAISERHDLLLRGKKISGNAFCFRHNKALHHGTLLIRTELEDLHGSLEGLSDIETYAVRSRRTEVTNIADLEPEIDVDGVAAAIREETIRAWSDRGGRSAHRIDERAFDDPQVDALADRNRSVEWVFDRTPKFTIDFTLPEGLLVRNSGEALSTIRLALTVDRGVITADSVGISAGFSRREHDRLAELLVGVRFNSRAVSTALAGVPEFSGLAQWIAKQSF